MTAKVITLADWARRESAARVRRWRCSAGLTQPEAAKRLGVSERQLRAWEGRDAKVPGWILVAIEREAA